MSTARCAHIVRHYGWLIALPLLALWVLNVSRPGMHPAGCPDGCAPTLPVSGGRLRVISYNVLHGFPAFHHLRERLDHLASEIRRQQADIVCLQEVPWAPGLGSAAHYLARQTGMNYLTLRANGNRWALLFEEGEAILSRYPLRDASAVELRPRAGFFEHRVVLSAVASTPQGDLRVFVTHLTHGEPHVNQGQAAALLALVDGAAGLPAAVAGDFNASEDSPQIQALPWVDAYRATHPDDRGYTCCIDSLNAGPYEPLEKRIDYLFLVPNGLSARVLDSHVVLDAPFQTTSGWLWPSDHVGLLAEIQLGP